PTDRVETLSQLLRLLFPGVGIVTRDELGKIVVEPMPVNNKLTLQVPCAGLRLVQLLVQRLEDRLKFRLGFGILKLFLHFTQLGAVRSGLVVGLSDLLTRPVGTLVAALAVVVVRTVRRPASVLWRLFTVLLLGFTVVAGLVACSILVDLRLLVV